MELRPVDALVVETGPPEHAHRSDDAARCVAVEAVDDLAEVVDLGELAMVPLEPFRRAQARVEKVRSPSVGLSLRLADRLGVRAAFDVTRAVAEGDLYASGSRAIDALAMAMTRQGWPT